MTTNQIGYELMDCRVHVPIHDVCIVHGTYAAVPCTRRTDHDLDQTDHTDHIYNIYHIDCIDYVDHIDRILIIDTRSPFGGTVTQEADDFACCTPMRSPASKRQSIMQLHTAI